MINISAKLLKESIRGRSFLAQNLGEQVPARILPVFAYRLAPAVEFLSIYSFQDQFPKSRARQPLEPIKTRFVLEDQDQGQKA